ncbi:uncharacterized protein PAC_10026 [Phialocephala subalpina]|uniref:Uncharacterized protein n=1 Tax=Phialocephala subalpina TaxID=576137 RepID=A0A1L7X527_9HELO|nr:uncharacterized protein PAC_10026 [Phialocephala subalpina]
MSLPSAAEETYPFVDQGTRGGSIWKRSKTGVSASLSAGPEEDSLIVIVIVDGVQDMSPLPCLNSSEATIDYLEA